MIKHSSIWLNIKFYSKQKLGLFDDEYSFQEQSDGLQILEWIGKQTWSNGKVVIYGKSWGGFNGLQLAFHQPKVSFSFQLEYSLIML